jgi:hypothetical protein
MFGQKEKKVTILNAASKVIMFQSTSTYIIIII